MTDPRGTIGLIVCAAGGAETVRTEFVQPAIGRGWQVAVTLTPTAATWLDALGEREALERTTGLVVRDRPGMPGERSPHPRSDCCIVSPATANTVAKLALGSVILDLAERVTVQRSNLHRP